MPKIYFITWSNGDGPIKAEETNTLLTAYTHRCDASRREDVAIPFFLKECVYSKSEISLLLRSRRRGNDRLARFVMVEITSSLRSSQ
jgi:hypothetical protein